MAKVELSYNPYLLETKVTFNGNTPRINSLIEKYSGKSIYNWINQMPSILHDEMNGYDFDLDFSGTEKDFEAMLKVFENVSDVELFHRNVLRGRLEKNEAIEELLAWLNENRNRQFDYEAFRASNTELFDTAYPFIILNGGKIDEAMFEGLNVSVDNLDDLSAIEDSDITNVPVLICVDADSAHELEHNIKTLLDRNDVIQRQLFFLLHPSINRKRTERMLHDLGMKQPQIIKDGDISLINTYMELYPITNFIRETILLMKSQYDQLKCSLETNLKENEQAGVDTREVVEDIEAGIERIKQQIELLVNRDNLNVPRRCQDSKYQFKQKIKTWRKRKTRITSDEDAKQYAMEFESDTVKYITEFTDDIDSIFELERVVLEKHLLGIYKCAGLDNDYVPNVLPPELPQNYNQIAIVPELLKLKHERMINQKDNFIFFSGTSNDEVIREVTYYNQEWRDCVDSLLSPKAQAYITAKLEALCKYETVFAEDLINHLNKLLELEIIKKNNVIAQMSEADRELQDDSDWLSQVNDKIDAIMRG